MTLTEQLLNELLTRLKRPGPLYILDAKEVPGMADQIRYRIGFPPIQEENEDVETQKFSYRVGGVEPVVELLPKDITFKEYTFEQGKAVHLELSYLDDADPPNEGPISKRDFVAADTVAPGAPGEMTVEAVGEE
jgi:hypothetical protein